MLLETICRHQDFCCAYIAESFLILISFVSAKFEFWNNLIEKRVA